MKPESTPGQFLLYTAPDGAVKVDVFFREETVWLTQKALAELFGVNVPAINKHLKNIFESGELSREATISKMEIARPEGGRTVSREVEFYNLDAIIAVGYRVNSYQATQFRIWATRTLRQFITKGFVLDDERLKQGKQVFGRDYFDELLERIREIRASERRFYQKVTDLYALAVDYRADAPVTKEFFATVQNKLHWAITGQTAAEVIYRRADATRIHMGLTTWKHAPQGKILKSDVTVAKNYLSEAHVKELNRVVSAYLDLAENRAQRGIVTRMADWVKFLHDFLALSNHPSGRTTSSSSITGTTSPISRSILMVRAGALPPNRSPRASSACVWSGCKSSPAAAMAPGSTTRAANCKPCWPPCRWTTSTSLRAPTRSGGWAATPRRGSRSTPPRVQHLAAAIAPLLRFAPSEAYAVLLFQNLTSQLALAHLKADPPAVDRLRESILGNFDLLPPELPEVQTVAEPLAFARSPGFWLHLDCPRIAGLERTFAPLMRFRGRRPAGEIIRLTLADPISSRHWIVFGPAGEGTFVEAYREQVAAFIRDLAEETPALRKLREGHDLTPEEIESLSRLLNRPDLFVTEDRLREAFEQPEADLTDFLRHILGQARLPSREQRISQAFEDWVARHPQLAAQPEYARVSRGLGTAQQPGVQSRRIRRD